VIARQEHGRYENDFTGSPLLPDFLLRFSGAILWSLHLNTPAAKKVA